MLKKLLTLAILCICTESFAAHIQINNQSNGFVEIRVIETKIPFDDSARRVPAHSIQYLEVPSSGGYTLEMRSAFSSYEQFPILRKFTTPTNITVDNHLLGVD